MEIKPSREIAKAPGAKSTLMSRPLSLFDEMERMFDIFQPRRAWSRPLLSEWPEFSGLETRIPNVDVVDYEDHILVRAELPGIDKKDVTITMTEKSLTLSGQSRHESKEEKGDYYCHEISKGAFTRTMSLPCAVDDSKAKAKFDGGILEITVPKIEKSTRHTIKIE